MLIAVFITRAQAGEILGLTPSGVSGLIERGALTSRGIGGRTGGERGSLDEAEVRALAAARRAARPGPPDSRHEWLNASEAAEVLGVTRGRIGQLLRRERIPGCQTKGGRWWVRADHLNLWLSANRPDVLS